MTKEEILAAIDRALETARQAKKDEMKGMSSSKERDMLATGFDGAIASLIFLREGIANAG